MVLVLLMIIHPVYSPGKEIGSFCVYCQCTNNSSAWHVPPGQVCGELGPMLPRLTCPLPFEWVSAIDPRDS